MVSNPTMNPNSARPGRAGSVASMPRSALAAAGSGGSARPAADPAGGRGFDGVVSGQGQGREDDAGRAREGQLTGSVEGVG